MSINHLFPSIQIINPFLNLFSQIWKRGGISANSEILIPLIVPLLQNIFWYNTLDKNIIGAPKIRTILTVKLFHSYRSYPQNVTIKVESIRSRAERFLENCIEPCHWKGRKEKYAWEKSNSTCLQVEIKYLVFNLQNFIINQITWFYASSQK